MCKNGEKMEKVSIIVPVYNAAEYVGKCLESVALQDYKNIEIIVVEDGSDDESPDVCKEYARRYDNIKVYHDKCGTAGAARNYGMSKADGDYVMFVDADDYLTDNCVVSELTKKMENVDIVVGNYQRLWKNRLLDASKNSGFAGLNMNSVDFAFGGFFSTGTLSYAWAKLYRKSFLDSNKIEFGDYRYAEDKIYNYFCYIAGARYAFIDKKIYVYRRNEQSVSNTYRKDGDKDWMRIAQDLQDKIDSLNYEKKQYSQDEIENYESIVAWTIYFAAFFDGKMEYEYSTGKIRAVINLLKRYASYDLTKKYLKNPLRYTKKIPALSYKIMLGGFAFLMKCNMYLLLSLGIKLLVDCHIDERLSDTGRKED